MRKLLALLIAISFPMNASARVLGRVPVKTGAVVTGMPLAGPSLLEGPSLSVGLVPSLHTSLPLMDPVSFATPAPVAALRMVRQKSGIAPTAIRQMLATTVREVKREKPVGKRAASIGRMFDGGSFSFNAADEPLVGHGVAPKLNRSHKGRQAVLVDIIDTGSRTDLEAKILLLERDYGFLRERSQEPEIQKNAPLRFVWGSVPTNGLARVKEAPFVISASEAVLSVERMSASPAKDVPGESYLTRILRNVHKKSEGAAILLMGPFAIGTLPGAFGPLMVGAGMFGALPGSLGPVILVGGILVLASFTAVQAVFSKAPPGLKAALTPVAIGAAAVTLAGLGYWFGAAVVGANALAGWVAHKRLLGHQGKTENRADSSALSTTGSAVLTGLGLSLVGAGILTINPIWGWSWLAAASVSLLLAAWPAKTADPDAVPPKDDLHRAGHALMSFDAHAEASKATKMRAGSLFVAALYVIGMFSVVSNLPNLAAVLGALAVLSIFTAMYHSIVAKKKVVESSAHLIGFNGGVLPNSLEETERLRQEAFSIAATERWLGPIVEEFEDVFQSVERYQDHRFDGVISELRERLAKIRMGELGHWKKPAIAYNLLSAGSVIIDAYREYIWADASVPASALEAADARLYRMRRSLVDMASGGFYLSKELDHLEAQARTLYDPKTGFDERRAKVLVSRIRIIGKSLKEVAEGNLSAQFVILAENIEERGGMLRGEPSPAFIEESQKLETQMFHAIRALWTGVES